MFFLAATLVGWIGGDFVYRKVAAKNIHVPNSYTFLLLLLVFHHPLSLSFQI